MPRLLPDEPLPPYSYVPGFFPHPRTPHDEAAYVAVEFPSEAACRESRAHLWAIDLFNYGYYWEAHEAWETLWNAAGRRGPAADLFKGLIKLAAAAVKLREGNSRGGSRHALRAHELFTSLAAAPTKTPGIFWGFSLAELQQAAVTLEALAREVHAPAPQWQLPVELQPRF